MFLMYNFFWGGGGCGEGAVFKILENWKILDLGGYEVNN